VPVRLKALEKNHIPPTYAGANIDCTRTVFGVTQVWVTRTLPSSWCEWKDYQDICFSSPWAGKARGQILVKAHSARRNLDVIHGAVGLVNGTVGVRISVRISIRNRNASKGLACLNTWQRAAL